MTPDTNTDARIWNEPLSESELSIIKRVRKGLRGKDKEAYRWFNFHTRVYETQVAALTRRCEEAEARARAADQLEVALELAALDAESLKQNVLPSEVRLTDVHIAVNGYKSDAATLAQLIEVTDIAGSYDLAPFERHVVEKARALAHDTERGDE